jgi:hypothetical protein
MPRVAMLVTAGLLLAAAWGCGAPATFVSTAPPPDAEGEAWFVSPLPAVRAALERAMIDRGLAVNAEASSPSVLVATKPQPPHITKNVAGPSSGPLPEYRVTATLARARDTHVTVTIDVRYSGDGTFAYEWDYPTDIIRDVFEGAKRTLHEKSPRCRIPGRFKPPRRPPPPPRRR